MYHRLVNNGSQLLTLLPVLSSLVFLVPKLHLGMCLSAKLYFVRWPDSGTCSPEEVQLPRQRRSQVQLGNEHGNGTDYVFLARKVNLKAGKASAKSRIVPMDSVQGHGVKTVRPTLKPNAAYQLGTDTIARVSIIYTGK